MAINPSAPKYPEVDISLLNGGNPDYVAPTGPSYSSPNFGIPQEIYNPELDITLLPGVPNQLPKIAYKHTQLASSNLWTINHNLNFFPNVTVFDSAGSMVEGSVTHTDNRHLTVAFSAAISGYAALS